MPIEKRDGRWYSYKNQDEKTKRFNDLVKDLKPHELEAFNELLKTNNNQIFENIDDVQWDKNTGPPVPIEEWLNSEYFLGQTAKDIYPVFKQDLTEIFNNNYSEIILCLHPDTKVPLLDGTTPTLKELAEKWNKDREPFWVYSMKDGEIIPAQAVAPRPTGVDDYYKVTLDNGSHFISNAKHEMMARDGSRLRVSDMKKGDSLMPFNSRKSEKEFDKIEGYELIHQPNLNEWEFTHRMVANKHIHTVRHKYESVIHHVNFMKEDNTPENLRFMKWNDHIQLHADSNNKWWKANPIRGQKIIDRLLAENKKRWQGPNNKENRKQLSNKMAKLFDKDHKRAANMGKVAWKNRSEEDKEKFRQVIIARNKLAKNTRTDITYDRIIDLYNEGYKSLNSVAGKLNCSTTRIKKVFKDLNKRHQDLFIHVSKLPEGTLIIQAPKNLRVKRVPKPSTNKHDKLLTIEMIKEAVNSGAVTQDAAATRLDCSRTSIQRALAELGLHWCDVSKYDNNHFVISVEKVGFGDVYCLTVPETSSFAIVPFGCEFDRRKSPQVSGIYSFNCGSVRGGKTFSASVGILRVIYELYCLADPSRSNGQGAGEPIEIVMFSHTKEAAKKVLFAKLKNMLMQSPFFKDRYEETRDEIRFTGKSIHVIGAASSDKDLLGTNVFAAIGDELNFLGSAKVNSEKSASGDGYDKASQVYNSLARRIKGTFQGRGKLFLVSSKKNSNDFTERRIRSAIEEKDEKVFVRDYAAWHSKPFRFSKQKWYRIAYSDKGSSPVILKTDEEKPPDGFNIIKFPEEFLPEMEKDPIGGLRDLCGVSIDSASAFLSDRLAIDRMFKDRPSLFDRDSWATGTRINVKWDEISSIDAKNNRVMTCCPGANRHVALDLSKSLCDTGFVIAHRAADGEVIRHNDEDGSRSLVEAPYVHIDAVLQIVPPAGKGTEIDHKSIRDLICKLRDDGIPIRSVSMDQWSGVPNAQELQKAGFKVERDFSVVRKPDAYITLKSLIYEDRLECPEHETLKKELYDLELTKEGKVEHSPTGKKDQADALAAAVYWLILNAKPSSGTSVIKGGHQNYYTSPTNEVGYNIKGDFTFPDESGGGDAPLFIVI